MNEYVERHEDVYNLVPGRDRALADVEIRFLSGDSSAFSELEKRCQWWIRGDSKPCFYGRNVVKIRCLQ